MPFINGRFYMNPAYGRALERARRANGVWSEQFPDFAKPLSQEQSFANDASSHDSKQRSSDSRWVTIDGHHVLISSTQASQSEMRQPRNEKRGTLQ
jgi:hypothetical protein